VSTADQLILARIAACARRHAASGVVDDLDAAVADLRETAGNRSDLLAQDAGLALGYVETGLPLLAPGFRAEAELCRAAGADETVIPAWVELGRRRAEQARRRPHTG